MGAIVKGPIKDYGNMSGNSKKPISKGILNYSVNQNNEIIHTRFVASHHCYRQARWKFIVGINTVVLFVQNVGNQKIDGESNANTTLVNTTGLINNSLPALHVRI